MGVQPRATLRYAPDHVAQWVVDDILEAPKLPEQSDGTVIDLSTRGRTE